MSSRAGQPTKVGRISTRIGPPSGAIETRWTIPRSTTESIGSSGSITSVRAARTVGSSRGEGGGWAIVPARARATADLDPGLAHQVAPGSDRRTEVNSPHSQRKASPWSSRPRSGSRAGGGIGRSRPAKTGSMAARQRVSSSVIGASRIPASRSAGSPGSGVKTVAASGAELGQSRQQPVARFAVGAGKAVEPRAGVHPVIALLADQLPDELGERRPRPAGERLETDDVGRVVQEASGDRHRPVAAAVVEQPAVAVVGGLAVVGERVGIGVGRASRAARTARPRGPARPGRSSSSPRPPRGAARSRSTPNRRSR